MLPLLLPVLEGWDLLLSALGTRLTKFRFECLQLHQVMLMQQPVLFHS